MRSRSVLGLAARRRRGDRRRHSRALRTPRHDDAGDQPTPGDGAARRRRCCRMPTAPRRGCGSRRGRTALVLLPGPPREMKPMLEAVVAERLAPQVGGPRAVPPRAEDHRPRRIGRRRPGAADLRPMGGAAGADQHDDSRGARADRAAPDRRRRRARPKRPTRARCGGAGAAGGARPGGLQHRRPFARAGRRRSAARAAS